MTNAAIDLGTNTFHLLIGQVKEGQIISVLKERRYVFVGQHGLSTIPEEVIARAETVLYEFAHLIEQNGVVSVKAVVTESLRTASNGNEVLDRWQKALGHPIHLITGLEEASYAGAAVIYGTGGRLPRTLAVDIGGGSVELILIEGQEIKEAKSVIAGISVLHRTFHTSDPIPAAQLQKMTEHLKKVLLTPLQEMGATSPMSLVGIAGSFEILPGVSNWENTPCRIIDTVELQKWYDELVLQTEEERRNSEFIPKERAQYIVEALAIIQTLVQSGLFELHLTCPYSLKEGLLLDH